MQTLYLITARGGSKGLPGKNVKFLNGRPLLTYSIDIARNFTSDNNICLSTDSQEIIDVAQGHGLEVPFVRPPELAGDTIGSRDVILHALDYYKQQGIEYDIVVLLQPTSPFRRRSDIQKMQSAFSPSIDMVVSVMESHYNPYFSLFEENEMQFLSVSKPGFFQRRQDCPKVYAYNGSVYIINTKSIRQNQLNQFKKIKKYVMDPIHSIDIDTQFDWWIAEMIVEKSLWKSE